MPGGAPWMTTEPTWLGTPTEVLYRVHRRAYSATAANQASRARFALTGGSHAMFYAADSVEGALWEVLLRDIMLGPGGDCEFPADMLKDHVLSKVRWTGTDQRRISLSRPGVLHLFPDGDGPEVLAVNELTRTNDHGSTHGEAREMLDCLRSLLPPISHMPMLSWKSRQFEDSTVFLSYSSPSAPSGWTKVGRSMDLDSDKGVELIVRTLRQHAFHWTPYDRLSTSIIDDDVT